MGRPRLLVHGARTRIVAWVLALVFAALTLATLTTWRLLVADAHARIDNALHSELDEFVAMTTAGHDPGDDDEPYTSVMQVLRSAITYNLAQPNEKFLGYVDGVYRFQSRAPAPGSLADDPAFTRLVADATAPAQGWYESSAGQVRYLSTPVVLPGHPGRGVIVVAYFVDRELAAANNAARVMAGAGAVTSLLAAAAAWAVAGRILRPVRDVARTARSITEHDLSARIPDRAMEDAHDEIGQLVQTVNAMLDRVEDGARAQRRFIDDAGHELRTPITIVRGHLEVLDVHDPTDVRTTLDLVDDELVRMNRIVSDLLTLAKAEQPRFVRPEPTDVHALLEETLTKASRLADRNWELADTTGLTSLHGEAPLDAQRITQALLVLADNATRHTRHGDTIRFGADPDTTTGQPTLRLWVADTGTGVAEQDRLRIFERFARGGADRRSDGAGLGLAIAAAIAAGHGGRLALSTGIGTARHSGPGATFTLVLPAGPVVAGAPVDDSAAPSPVAAG